MYIIRLAQFILKKRLPPSRGGLGAKGGGGNQIFMKWTVLCRLTFNEQKCKA